MKTNYRDFGLTSTSDLSLLLGAAKRERAIYVAGLISAALERLARVGSAVRETAVACTAARLHLS